MSEPTALSAVPGSALARRLRELRIAGFPDVKLTQRQLAEALSEDEPVARLNAVILGERPGACTAAAKPPQRICAVLRHGALTEGHETPLGAAQ